MKDHLFVICVYWSEPLACTFGVNAITKFIAIEDDVSNETSVYREKNIPMIALLI